ATAETSCGSGTPTTSAASRTPWGCSGRRRADPPSSSWTATSATAPPTSTTPPRPTASRSARGRSASPNAPTAGPPTRISSCPTAREPFAAGVGRRGAEARRRWTEQFAAYREKHPGLATDIDQMQRRELPAGWDRNLPAFPPDAKGLAGRDASGRVLNLLAQN